MRLEKHLFLNWALNPELKFFLRGQEAECLLPSASCPLPFFVNLVQRKFLMRGTRSKAEMPEKLHKAIAHMQHISFFILLREKECKLAASALPLSILSDRVVIQVMRSLDDLFKKPDRTLFQKSSMTILTFLYLL